METLTEKLRQFKFLIGIALFFLFVLGMYALFIGSKKESVKTVPKVSTPIPTPILIQQPFRVIQTQPGDGDNNVNPGELEISFATDQPIVSSSSFTLEITPKLPYYWRFINSYPTTQVRVRVFGGLDANTKYFVTVKDRDQNVVYSFSFTASVPQDSSSTGLVKEEEEKFIQKYQPLFGKVPYATADFSIDYIDKLTLEVIIRNRDVEKTKREVLQWIQSQGVDPNTHTITYINRF